MDMTDPRLAFPKPEPRRRTKGRKDRVERVVRQSVRAQCVERDHDCRLGAWFWRDDFSVEVWGSECRGESEWAHLKGHRRSQTRGQAPEARHTTTHSLMLCTRHHGMEERGRLIVTPLTPRGCDGPLRFEVKEGR